ncbi:Fic/DOC family protein [Dielma fastidiosa]|uniref:Fic/DOC family protein n=1 Tax=Dielma fastidiosa TaxID=1034346 RepID=UPI000E555F2B|nr:Fic family protein [Dielma fastidiosa]RHN02737.1 hypothetical protein DWZ33_01290 [Dielma fastidiosa]
MAGGKYCYPYTDVLINKYGIQNKELLEKLEIQKVTVKLLGLQVNPERIKYTFDTEHFVTLHWYLFSDIYEWAGRYREENLYKNERVLSGGSVEYADYHDISDKLAELFEKVNNIDWKQTSDLIFNISDFLLELWCIHSFREGNTRTCVAFLWHYLKGRGIDFHLELLKNNPMYVRDSLVMASYDHSEYLRKIISDALKSDDAKTKSILITKSDYRIKKSEYKLFSNKIISKK